MSKPKINIHVAAKNLSSETAFAISEMVVAALNHQCIWCGFHDKKNHSQSKLSN